MSRNNANYQAWRDKKRDAKRAEERAAKRVPLPKSLTGDQAVPSQVLLQKVVFKPEPNEWREFRTPPDAGVDKERSHPNFIMLYETPTPLRAPTKEERRALQQLLPMRSIEGLFDLQLAPDYDGTIVFEDAAEAA